MEPIVQLNNNDKVWIVTGTSSGLGLELTKKLLIEGYKVAAFTRKPEELSNKLKEINVTNLLIVKSDVTNDENVKESVLKTVNHFGNIDVVVNNHGYGLIGTVEEISDEEYREQFNVNFFGALNILRHTVPYLRKQKSGLIFNVSSVLGWVDLEAYSAYDSSKHALNAVTFSLAKELKPFGIDVVLLSPGGFKTSFLDGGNLKVPANPVPEYNTYQVVDFMNQYVNSTRGDPAKFAKVVIEISNLQTKPENFFAGTDAATAVKPFLERNISEIEKWFTLSTSTDLDGKGDQQLPKLDF